jgi:hypothetical protein
MPNRRLSAEELANAAALLGDIRVRINQLSGGDRELRFAYNRKVGKELTYDERGKPMLRRRLKKLKWEEQDRRCAKCGEGMPLTYSVLDRFNAVDGYTSVNTQLIHAACDYEAQAANKYGNNE